MILERFFQRKRKQTSEYGIPSLPGNLWLDQPDAHDRIDARLRKGTLTAEQAERLHHWVEFGFLTFPVNIDDRWVADIQETIERAWKEKPADLPYAFEGQLHPFTRADEAKERRSPYRVMDIHSHSQGALEIFLNRQIFDYLQLVFGEPAVAIQSIFFEFGSQQGHHRDPVYVVTTPPSHLIAGWYALEDIDPRSGALSYIPGSHKLPYFEFAPGRYIFNHQLDPEEKVWEMDEFNRQQVAKHNLKTEIFAPKKGEASIWHASLLHGGSVIEDPALTRKSLVVHYSTLEDYKAHGLTVMQRKGGVGDWEPQVFMTSRVLERNGCHGFDNPLKK